MNRSAALTALLTAQAKPKIAVEQTIDRGTRSGLTSAGAPLSRVRDRMTIQEQTKPEIQKPLTERQKLIEENAAAYYRKQENEKRERDEKERRAQEREAAENRARWQAEEDRKTLEANRQRQTDIIFNNSIRADIRALLKDEEPDVIEEVIRRVKAAKMQHFVPAWESFLQKVKQERAK